jgi:hypothetical protein
MLSARFVRYVGAACFFGAEGFAAIWKQILPRVFSRLDQRVRGTRHRLESGFCTYHNLLQSRIRFKLDRVYIDPPIASSRSPLRATISKSNPSSPAPLALASHGRRLQATSRRRRLPCPGETCQEEESREKNELGRREARRLCHR